MDSAALYTNPVSIIIIIIIVDSMALKKTRTVGHYEIIKLPVYTLAHSISPNVTDFQNSSSLLESP